MLLIIKHRAKIIPRANGSTDKGILSAGLATDRLITARLGLDTAQSAGRRTLSIRVCRGSSRRSEIQERPFRRAEPQELRCAGREPGLPQACDALVELAFLEMASTDSFQRPGFLDRCADVAGDAERSGVVAASVVVRR